MIYTRRAILVLAPSIVDTVKMFCVDSRLERPKRVLLKDASHTYLGCSDFQQVSENDGLVSR